MGFDAEGARKAGYDEKTIKGIQDALAAGYTQDEIMAHLNGESKPSGSWKDQQPKGNIHYPQPPQWKKVASQASEILLPAGGAVLGGALATPETLGIGTPAGVAGGYMAGKAVDDVVQDWLGFKTPPQNAYDVANRVMDTARGGMETAIFPVAAEKAISTAAIPLQKVLGKTTGAGEQALKSAYSNSDAFKRGYKGESSIDDVLDKGINKLRELRDLRGKAYKDALTQIEQKREIVIDKNPVMSRLDNLMKNYRITMKDVVDAEGNVIGKTADFSRSTVDRSARSGLGELIDDVRNWDDWTPTGVDALKQRVNDFYSPSKNTSAFVSNMYDTLHKSIVSKVPEYAKMTRDYADTSRKLNEIQKALSINPEGKFNKDTAIRKLETAFRDVNKYRLSQINSLDPTGEFRDELAGTAMNSWLTRGQLPFSIYGGALSAGAFMNPYALTMAPALSPKMVGKGMQYMGNTGRFLGAINPAYSAAGVSTTQNLADDWLQN